MQMVDQFLKCFKIWREANEYYPMTKKIPIIAGKKEQELYLVGHGTNVVTTCNFFGQRMNQTFLPFVDIIQDYACSPFIKSTPRVSTKWMGIPHLRMA
jgi:hypothetical protein